MTNYVSILLGLLGLAGVVLTLLMYISPRYRADWYLNNPNKWEQINLKINGDGSLWRHIKHPEFMIEIQDDGQKWDSEVMEGWMKNYPDSSKSTHMVHVKVGGVVIYAERFIYLDGGRYFTPLPRVIYHNDYKMNEYYYVPVQIKIARIIGSYYLLKNVDEFITSHKINVCKKRLKNESTSKIYK